MSRTRRPAATDHPWAPSDRHLRGADRRWPAILDRIGPCPLQPRTDRFQALAGAILSQQISTRASQSIRAKLMAALSDRLEPDRLLALSADHFRASGISRSKEAYLRDLSDAVATGRLDLAALDSAPDDEVIAQLTAIKGIGVWTAQMYLIFTLNRPDILPVGDLGIRVGLQLFHGLAETPKPAECPPLAEPWGPHRTLAMWYLWRLVEEGRSPQQ